MAKHMSAVWTADAECMWTGELQLGITNAAKFQLTARSIGRIIKGIAQRPAAVAPHVRAHDISGLRFVSGTRAIAFPVCLTT